MKKLAIAFSSKDRVELSQQTIGPLLQDGLDVFWVDGSATNEGEQFVLENEQSAHEIYYGVRGGADRAIVFALSQMLADKSYSHVGLLENDVLLDTDWLEPCLDLFKYSRTEGLPIGAVSARCYEDRILIQRDGYAICHNVGAGHVIFTREAATIILNTYRSGWWPENRAVFSQLSGIDIGKFGAFGFKDQILTGDWSWDTILAAHGLATVALTPSKATMIGQDLTMEQQGLKYANNGTHPHLDEPAFDRFRRNLIDIHAGKLIMPPVDHNLRTRNGTMIFPQHAARHGGIWGGEWKTGRGGLGPFAYVAGAGASLIIPVFGACAFLVSGGRVSLRDDATGFSTDVDLTGNAEIVSIAVPRDMQTGIVRLEFGEGTCLAAIETLHPQAERKDVSFNYSMLPEAG